ncbi:RND superfamily putative drug exporter [Mumia flava]|uniref:RND superfamily putative drug exporter n=1 Tax=Mumia flava TaxID=1348852 RepID=A0A2M9BHJ6_9ACTN|nr:MMPL family transporter [Mumia flava]PJJ57435.1 RND superfamily putative drug exporter [Mumia flava]
MSSFLTAHLASRRLTWAVAIVPLLLAVAVIGGLGQAATPSDPASGRPDGAESSEAATMAAALPDDDTEAALALYTAGPADGGERLDEADLEAVGAAAEQARRQLGLPEGPPPVLSDDRTAATVVLALPTGGDAETDELVAELRVILDESLPEGLDVAVTGPAAVTADLSAVFDGADTRLLLATATIVALLLLVTYRSPVLWLIPLTVVAVADQFAATVATRVLDALSMTWDESTIGILSVLVFGAGTDYALLLVARYRDELKAEPDRYRAMRTAVRRTAEAVLSSAVTVVAGVATLLLSLFPTYRALGLACAIGVLIAAAFALVVLPAALVGFGRWVFWPRVPRLGQARIAETRSVWSRLGSLVTARPVTLLVAAGIVLAALGSGLLQVKTGLSDADQFLDEPEAISAASRLAESFPAGSASPVRVVTTGDAEAVVQAVGTIDGVTSAREVASGDGVSEVQVVLDAPQGSDAAADGVVAIRDAVTAAGLESSTAVGGADATLLDSADASARDRTVILPLVAGLVFVALLVLLRSVVAAALLVGTVLVTYLAALGAAWWLFTGVFGFAAMDVGVPLLSFLFLVALGVDYSIFLVTRAYEESRGRGTGPGMIRALVATGGVITSAGILLAAVFAVLGVLPLVVLAQIGIVIGIGVLLDTLLVRTVVVPSLAVLLGDRFWWPRAVPGSPGAEPVRPDGDHPHEHPYGPALADAGSHRRS